MKIRNGFVSNSSSASFVIKWTDKKERTLNAAIAEMYDLTHFNIEEDKFSWDGVEIDRNVSQQIAATFLNNEKNIINIVDRLLKNTITCPSVSDDSVLKQYRTSLHTIMYNDYASFYAEDIVMPLLVKNDFEIIQTYIKEDKI